ncbi:MAG: RnfH family protein [Burkholderia sp.]|nr:MAG: Persistence and stress-resistance antitoxin PasI [Burkholderia gladioli]
MLHVQVCYALSSCQTLLEVELLDRATVRDAIEASGIIELHPDIDIWVAKTGVFGKLAPLNMLLQEGDRVEIYRPLIVDPKAARQRRVEKTRREGSVEGRKWLPKDSR